MNNPLLAAFEAVDQRREFWLGHPIRNNLCKQFAWAIPNAEAIQALAKLGPIVEIGAGTGYWASLIAAVGGDIVAYDAKPYHNYWCGGTYHPILTGGPEMAQKHSNRTLLLCWPPYDEAMAADALLAYEGRTVAYVGEGCGGCTGDYEFHGLLETLYNDEATIAIPQWGGLHDDLSIWRRK